jgi:hypothetical protein
MEKDQRKEILEIMNQFECPKGFNCYKSHLDVLCKARDIGLETFLECLEENPQYCHFAVPFGYTHFCKCPLRVYIAKQLKK